jgi:hypothetical protein
MDHLMVARHLPSGNPSERSRVLYELARAALLSGQLSSQIDQADPVAGCGSEEKKAAQPAVKVTPVPSADHQAIANVTVTVA